MAPRGPEIRIGLVLYGGVSLAVYIYGVVVEVQRLLAAAAELERGEAETAYAKALQESGASSVTVDIVSGTSAGGINGILLAKALAQQADVRSASALWIDHGDIDQLLHLPSKRDPRSLLESSQFERAVRKGLAGFDEGAGKGAAKRAAVLDLFVSSTHLRGGRRIFTDSLKHEIGTRQHRYVFRLKLRSKGRDRQGRELGYGRDDFRNNERLVRLARATSAFPVAFEPVLIPRSDELFDNPEDGDGWFADGGILNNKPFTEAVGAIVSRRSDRPVRRWLFSLDPDPKPLEEEVGAGEAPAFDQIALRSVAAIPRYQSIARDLVALKEHNEKVDAAEQAVRAGEEELTAALRTRAEGESPPGLGPGLEATYAAQRRQAWAKEVADGLVANAPDPDVEPSDGAEADWGEVHHAFRSGAESLIEELGPLPDLAFQRRRVYYLIKLLSMEAEVEVESGDLAAVREALWAEFEAISGALWDAFGERVTYPPPAQTEDREVLARNALAAATARLVEVERAVERRLGEGLTGVVVLLGRREDEERKRPPFPVRLDDVFAHFERRDAALLPAELYGGLERRDRVRYAQISPEDALNTGIDGDKKLAGTSLGHFGGFLDAGWRRNDIVWGRLDGADVLMRAILDEPGVEDPGNLTDAVQEEILAEDLPQVMKHPGGWREGLEKHVGPGPSLGDLDGGKLVGLGLRAAAVLRRMLRTAARDVTDGGVANRVRAFLLRTVANLLGFFLALLYLPSTALFGKGKLVRRLATAAAFLPFLWGLATLALGIAGVLPFAEVVGPAAVGIAIYPAFLIGYWGLRWIVFRFKHWARRSRS